MEVYGALNSHRHHGGTQGRCDCPFIRLSEVSRTDFHPLEEIVGTASAALLYGALRPAQSAWKVAEMIDGKVCVVAPVFDFTDSVTISVASIADETSDSKSIVLRVPQQHVDLFDYLPGQFLTVRVPIGDDNFSAQRYFLASSPHCEGEVRMVVTRTPHCLTSNWIFDHVEVGDTLEVIPPTGSFTPVDLNSDMMMFARGDGIVPVISIIKSVLVEGTGRVVLFFANESASSVIFGRELQFLAEDNPDHLTVFHLLEDLQGVLESAQFASIAMPFLNHEVFVCGHRSFLETVGEALSDISIPATKVHYELSTSSILSAESVSSLEALFA